MDINEKIGLINSLTGLLSVLISKPNIEVKAGKLVEIVQDKLKEIIQD